MKLSKALKFLSLTLSLSLFVSCDFFKQAEVKYANYSKLSKSYLALSKKNRQLQMEIEDFKDKVRNLGVELNYCKTILEEREKSEDKLAQENTSQKYRTISSSAPADSVKFDVYKWDSKQIMAMATNYFKSGDYKQASEYFIELYKNYPNDQKIDDHTLFISGLAFYESGQHFNLAIEKLKQLTLLYPESEYYRGAKMWMGLSYLKMGQKREFSAMLEEFRLKYRNTDEWNVLKVYYEKFAEKY